MKKDLDLFRSILTEIEDAPTFDRPLIIEVAGYSDYEVVYHLQLLADAGYIKIISGTKTSSPWPKCLTLSGHDLLASIKSDTVFEKIKAFIKEKGGAFTLEIVKSLGTKLLESHLGL